MTVAGTPSAGMTRAYLQLVALRERLRKIKKAVKKFADEGEEGIARKIDDGGLGDLLAYMYGGENPINTFGDPQGNNPFAPEPGTPFGGKTKYGPKGKP